MNEGGDLVIEDTEVSGNAAVGDRSGGGICNDERSTAVLENSIVSGNSTSYLGGGINSSRGNVRATAGSISGNSAGAPVHLQG